MEVDSWTTGSEFAAQVLHSRGIETNSSGWTVALSEHDHLYELPGEEYVMDLIAGMEIPPAFPSRSACSLYSGPAGDGARFSSPITNGVNSDSLQESPVVARRSRSPPVLTRKLSREALEVHDKVNEMGGAGSGGVNDPNGLSRSSALNSRYFDDKSKSRSLDNLLEPMPAEAMQDLGLSSSRLNERYHSVERLTEGSRGSAAPPTSKPTPDTKEIINSVVQKGWPKHEKTTEYSRAPSSTSSRYIKAPQGMGRRGPHGALGAQNSRAYIEREYMKSSAMSDTSEAPSLGELNESIYSKYCCESSYRYIDISEKNVKIKY